eukprot:CAMPEP_0197261214 /NCGR_PEP_ID=MMETSP1429-20130617/84430_1 /TAXON_ID=49237 /ORGANISM="Chaetoceros  sp., Strain UNC1202" /LENGTH=174 /DNA_ID=CAMNT_0042725471 /DNA_START=524 /DNA_END=1048 /DNA_ORIENTATION=-
MAGIDNSMTDEHIQRLKDIGFVWEAKQDSVWKEKDCSMKVAKADSGWERNYKDLVKFKKKHKHTIVPKKYAKNQVLSSWVFRQRKHYRLRQENNAHHMSDERLKKLDDIGFVFQVRKKKESSMHVNKEDVEKEEDVESTNTAKGEGNGDSQGSETESACSENESDKDEAAGIVA